MPYGLNSAFPWSRPTIALALQDGVGEVEVAAAAEVYSGGSFSARTLAVGPDGIVTTRHGMVLTTHALGEPVPGVDRVVAPGVDDIAELDPVVSAWAQTQELTVELPEAGYGGHFPFDAYLHDLARTADRATALATAKYLEYPTAHLELDGRAWPLRPTGLLVAAVLVSIGAGWLVAAAARSLAYRRRLGTPDRQGSARAHDAADPMTNLIPDPVTTVAGSVSPGTAEWTRTPER